MRDSVTAGVLALILLVGVSACAQVNEQALAILKKTIEVRGTVNFSGLKTIVLFENGVKVRGFEERVHEKSPGKQRVAVMAPKGETGRLSVTNAQVQWQYFPDKNKVVRRELPTLEQLRADRLADLDDLAKRMKIQYLGTETIAGRAAHVILVATQEEVPVKKKWIDTEHYLRLKTQRFDFKGRIKSSAYYTAINYQPQYADGMFSFDPRAGCEVCNAPLPRRMHLRAAERVCGFRAAMPRYVPPGYRLQRKQVAVTPQEGQTVLWLPFSNGVDTFSIFQRPLGMPSPPSSRWGSLQWNRGKFSFVLVGPLPINEMKRVRDSVQ